METGGSLGTSHWSTPPQGVGCSRCSPGSSTALWARHPGEVPDLPGQVLEVHSTAKLGRHRRLQAFVQMWVEGGLCPEGAVASAAGWGVSVAINLDDS